MSLTWTACCARPPPSTSPGAEIELVSLVARENRLRNAIRDYLEHRDDEGLPSLDYVLIDCPPSLGLLTVNALVAAREVLIPIQAEYYALEGLSLLLNNIELIRQHLNPDLVVSSIMLTMYDARTRLAAQVAQDVREHFPEQTLETTIPRSVKDLGGSQLRADGAHVRPGIQRCARVSRSSPRTHYSPSPLIVTSGHHHDDVRVPASLPWWTFIPEKTTAMTQKRGLGRGLGALIPGAGTPPRSRAGAAHSCAPGVAGR